MGKDLTGKELGRGFSQRPDGRYEARAVVNGKERENKTFATYIGKWRDQPYFCWIDDYVKRQK